MEQQGTQPRAELFNMISIPICPGQEGSNLQASGRNPRIYRYCRGHSALLQRFGPAAFMAMGRTIKGLPFWAWWHKLGITIIIPGMPSIIHPPTGRLPAEIHLPLSDRPGLGRAHTRHKLCRSDLWRGDASGPHHAHTPHSPLTWTVPHTTGEQALDNSFVTHHPNWDKDLHHEPPGGQPRTRGCGQTQPARMLRAVRRRIPAHTSPAISSI